MGLAMIAVRCAELSVRRIAADSPLAATRCSAEPGMRQFQLLGGIGFSRVRACTKRLALLTALLPADGTSPVQNSSETP